VFPSVEPTIIGTVRLSCIALTDAVGSSDVIGTQFTASKLFLFLFVVGFISVIVLASTEGSYHPVCWLLQLPSVGEALDSKREGRTTTGLHSSSTESRLIACQWSWVEFWCILQLLQTRWDLFILFTTFLFDGTVGCHTIPLIYI
jgi:hypothetical protein